MIFVSSCSVFEAELLNTNKEGVFSLDTAASFTKSVVGKSNIEKKVFSRLADSSILFNDLVENESYLLNILYDSTGKTLSGNTLRKMGLEYDSIHIVSQAPISKATFYSKKKSLLYDINKTHFITFNRTKVISKTIKIKQKLLLEEQKEFEINYNYDY